MTFQEVQYNPWFKVRMGAFSTNAIEYGELPISPKLVSMVLMLVGLGFLVVADTGATSVIRFNLLLFALLFDTLAAVIWVMTDWRSELGRWFTLGVVVVLAIWGPAALGQPELLIFAPVPIALALALLGLPAACGAALSETLLLCFWPTYDGGGFPSTISAISAIWATLGLLFASQRPVQHIIAWSWQHFERAQWLLEEARDRQAELAQTLEDLAHANRQLTLLNEKLAGLRLLAEEAQSAKAIFVAKVSHEFRTPLNIIISLIDLLTETPEVYGKPLPPLLLEDLTIVQRNCAHLANLVNDVLDLSQAEAGHLTMQRRAVDVGAQVEDLLGVVRPLVEKKKLSLAVAIAPDLTTVYCDLNRTRQVILNLVSNAARFTDKGGITVQVVRQEPYALFSIHDTGAGIDPEHAERIFEPFYQGVNPGRVTSSGYGLGLSVSKQFVELQGGKMWFTSRPGVGSTFYFTLPLAPPEPPLVRPGRWLREDWIWREHTNRRDLPRLPFTQRIVVCDASGALPIQLAQMDDEIEFIATRDLTQAAKELAVCPAHALIINTSATDELEALAESARAVALDTPIIACSFQPPLQRALEAGAIHYLLKPVMIADLKKALQLVDRPLRHILVVDDDPDFQRLLQRMLATYAGVQTITIVGNGADALANLHRQPPDLLLVDIILPDMTGWQILAEKNRAPWLRMIPTIILSAQDLAEQPLTSKGLLATVSQGFSVNKLLTFTLEWSALLLQADVAPGRAPR